MNKKVVFFNGPPRSGKDLAVTSLMDCYDNVEHIKFSAPLKTALPVFFGLSPSQAVRLEQTKDTKTDDLLGMSFREAQISLSENWAKPTFGEGVFGEIALNNIKRSSNSLFFISDSGFYEEAKCLVEALGEDNCLLIRLSRKGYDFTNDSRSYWDHEYNMKEVEIKNDSNPMNLIYSCISEIDGWRKNDNSI